MLCNGSSRAASTLDIADIQPSCQTRQRASRDLAEAAAPRSNAARELRIPHIEGHGAAAKLAAAIHDALATTGTPPESPAAASPKLDLDTEKIDDAMGRKGKDNRGIYQFSVARAQAIRERGIEIPTSMGVATAINFQPIGNGHAAITGDFVLIASKVNPVIAAFREKESR